MFFYAGDLVKKYEYTHSVVHINTDLQAGICFGWKIIVKLTHFELFESCVETDQPTDRPTDIPIPRCFVAEA